MMRRVGLFLLAVCLLAACNGNILMAPTATPKPASTGLPAGPTATPQDPCLVGTWDLKDLSDYVVAILPPDALSGARVERGSQRGRVRYSFAPDGTLIITVNDFNSNYLVTADGTSYEMSIQLVGLGSGKYLVNNGQISVSNIRKDELAFGILFGGETMIDAEQVAQYLPLFNAYAEYTCSQDELVLKLANQPPTVQPLKLKRVGS